MPVRFYIPLVVALETEERDPAFFYRHVLLTAFGLSCPTLPFFRTVRIHVQKKSRKPSEPAGFFEKLFGGKTKEIGVVAEARTVKPRKAPIKIEPKVFFSNERTFLAWMHVSVILAGASVAILALSDYENIGKQLYV